jgi:hypothetical protein
VPVALQPGATYIWQVTAVKDGEQILSSSAPPREARFRVLSAAQAAELSRAAREHANSHLVLGTLYAQAGLLDDAERELRALLVTNPQSAVARKLLLQVRALRR